MEANTTLIPEAEEDVQKSTHFLMSIDTKGLEILANQISNILKNYTQQSVGFYCSCASLVQHSKIHQCICMLRTPKPC